MGIIERQIRSRSNQKLAAPVSTSTTMTAAQVIATLKGICDANNAETVADVERWKTSGSRISRWAAKDKDPTREHYYHLAVRDDHVLIGFRRTPERILADTRATSSFDAFWLAHLELPVAGDKRRVTLTLLRWVADGNSGTMKDRGFYESLVTTLFEAVGDDSSQ